MRNPYTKPLCFFILALLATATFSTLLTQRFQNPFPPLSETLSSPLNRLEDFIGIATGYRRLFADFAWIETLEYYGTHEEGQTDFEEDNGMGKYPLFLEYGRRTTLLDPYFTFVYYYGAGVLGWNLNRVDEAETLLRQGIRSNPDEWRLQQYLIAISYTTQNDPMKIINFLEGFVYEPDCPNILRNMLARLYEKQNRNKDALRVYLLIKAFGESEYTLPANEGIQRILAESKQNMGLRAH